MIRRDGFDYRVGLKLFELGSVALAQHEGHQIAMPYMSRLSRATGMSVYLATLSGPDVVFIDECGLTGPPRCVGESRIPPPDRVGEDAPGMSSGGGTAGHDFTG
ncbi:hypothetical protein GS416_01650 [Rhodococcus hoagii]|nr:hypothetical protein [Prescottella equi]